MALRISNAELNSLMHVVGEGNGGYDAGFTNDPAMDEYLDMEAELFMLDIDLQERYGNQEDDDYSCDEDWADHNWYDLDDYDVYCIHAMPVVEHKKVVETAPERLMTIAEIIAKHKEESVS